LLFSEFFSIFAAILAKSKRKVMKIELMQFSAVLLMATLTLKLILQPKRVICSPTVNRSRWLLAGGTMLLGIQFLLQFLLGLRSQGVSAAVMLNLAFFIPCTMLFCLAIINLQRRGFLSRREQYIGFPVWILALALIFLGIKADEGSNSGDSTYLRWAEIGASTLFAAMIFYYISHQIRYMKKIRHAVANFYDSDLKDLLNWMQWSISLLAMMAVLAPLMIFTQGALLGVFAIMILLGIFYLIDCFCLYLVSNAPAKVGEAQQNEEDVRSEEMSDLQQKSEDQVSESAFHRVEQAVDAWIEKRGHLKAGLNLPTAAEEIGIPRYLLSAWIKQKGLRYSDWLTALRIEEAKQVMRAHPDWSNESVAQHCGFSDRTYFQRKFKDLTGLTPSDFLTK
jgi:AraC-like DNA-binding protein